MRARRVRLRSILGPDRRLFALVLHGLAVLGAVVVTHTPAFAWGMVAYHPPTLEAQLTRCPPQGPNPWGGCDQCLTRIYHPVFPLHRIFCGRLDQDWCAWGRTCNQCNGSCSIIWQDEKLAYVSILQPTATIQTAIGLCRQWATDTYCTPTNGGPIAGAYLLSDEFDWIPIHESNYQNLLFDPDYLYVLNTYQAPMANGLEAAWRHRIGIFSVLTARDPGPRRSYWERAANLSAWYYIRTFSEPDEGDAVLAQNGFPAAIGGQDFDDLVDIFESTCSAPPFLDCWHSVAPTTWGAIKERFRAPEE